MPDPVRPHRGVFPAIGERVYIDPASVVIGDVRLGDDVSVWPGAVLRGDLCTISVGARSNVQDNAVLHTTHESRFNPSGWALTVGEEVVIGHGAVLHGCTVGNRVLVGIGSVVNDGAVVEDEVVVGAGCIVPPGKVLRTGYVYVGNPCRELRPLTERDREFLRYSPAHYVELKDEYLEGQA